LTKNKSELAMTADQVKAYSDKALFFPSTLEIETTTHCNINPPCVMCYPRIFDKRKFKGEIDKVAFERLIPHMKKFNTISLHGVGEPLIGNKLFTILNNLDTEKTCVQFNSNGLMLTEDISRLLIKKKLSLIDFSIDAASAITYQKIRRSDFLQVTNNIKRLSELKKEMKVKHPVIMLNMTLMKENLPEAVSFIEMAIQLGAEIVHFGLLNPFKEYQIEHGGFIFNYKDQMIALNSSIFKKTIDLAKQKAAELGIKLSLEFSRYYS